MTSLPEVSSCVDCATPIIGDYQRCFACQEQCGRKETTGQILVFWVVFVELLAMGVCGILLAVKGCS